MRPIEEIVQTLIINGTLTDQPGLFYGKTGIAVFFFHYARQTGYELFQDYAIELLNEIQEQITVTVSVRYDTGLAGIGTGYEYFLQNNFLEAEGNDIFEDFDARMYRAAMYEPYPDMSLEGGLTGWGRYFIYRLLGCRNKDEKLHEALTCIANKIAQKTVENSIPENEQPDVYRFLYDLTRLPGYAEIYHTVLQQCRKLKCIREPNMQKLFPYMNNLQRLHACQHYFNTDLTYMIEQEWDKWKKPNNNPPLTEIGLLKGWTAEGLLRLTSIDKHDTSWINLL